MGHVGDGNLHVILPYRGEAERERVKGFSRAAVGRSLELGGMGKREFLEAEHGAEAVEGMRMIKRGLDPRGILNPGKVLPG